MWKAIAITNLAREAHAARAPNAGKTPMDTNADEPRVVVSYLTLRKTIGTLGVLLPVLLAIGGYTIGTRTGLQPSISDYYATEMGDVFVGVLFVMGWFLFSYKGYERKDDIAGDLACLCAMGVALFSTSSESGAIRTVHFVSATSLFLILAYFSLCLFTKTRAGEVPPAEKQLRNRVYRTCGWIMLACIALIPVYFALLADTALAAIQPVFWLESLALWAFGVSWVTKGRMLWKDAAPAT